MTEQWADDQTLITRSAAADLFASLIGLNGWEQSDPPAQALRLVTDGSQQ